MVVGVARSGRYNRTIGGALLGRWQASRPAIPRRESQEGHMLSTLLLVVVVLLLIGALPAWPYSRGWGYYPSGGLGLILIILLILVLVRQA